MAAGAVGGYQCDLINPLPDRLQCNICHLPSRDPYLSVCCGHLFCKSCVEYSIKVSGITNVCPVCRSDEFMAFPNKAVDREINFLRVYCNNMTIGCEWQGELNSLKNHLVNSDGCQFELVNCPNYCGKVVQRQYLINHVKVTCVCRTVNCQYCHCPGEYQFIEGQHKNKCPKVPLQCPNKCEVGIVLREDMKSHRLKCQLEVIDCPNHCGKKFERQCLSNHIKICPCHKIKCQYCHSYTAERQFVEGQHKRICPKFPIACPNKCDVGTIVREEMEAHRKECPLEVIQCEYFCVGCETKVARKDYAKHKKENVEEHLMKANIALKYELDDTNFELTSTRQDLIDATVALADAKHELTNTNEQLATALQRISVLEALMYITMNEVAARPSISRALVQSSLRWPVRLAAMALISKSDDQLCPVVLEISNFNEAKRRNLTLYSSLFNSSGCRLRMHVLPNGYGDGKTSHLSCYLYCMTYSCDDGPSSENFEIKLLNQISNNRHHSVFVTCYNGSTRRSTSVGRAKPGWGKSQFISNENLHVATATCQFLKDDCLFFQVTQV